MATDFLPGNRITLLDSGKDYFPALLTAIDGAQRDIFLESYIYADDEIGRQVSDALCRAAERGVLVKVTVDGFGGRNFSTDFLPRLTQAGVRAMLYRPEISTFHFRRHRLRRLHRKLAIIDARQLFVGGINIVDDYNAPAEMCPRYDYAVQVEGPVVQPALQAARRIWEVVSWVSFKRRFRFKAPDKVLAEHAGSQSAAFLIRDNIRHRNDIQHAYLEAIAQARDEILIANAYFLPGVRFGRALQAAAKRGVRITVLLQGKTDHPLLRFAAQALYAVALGHGIRIFEYEKSFMHAKVAVIDGEWATVGSSNIDPFSLLLAKEANLVVRDAKFAGELRHSIRQRMADGAREMYADELSQHAWPTRLIRWFSYALVRAMIGLTGYGPKHWQTDEEPPGIKPETPPQ